MWGYRDRACSAAIIHLGIKDIKEENTKKSGKDATLAKPVRPVVIGVNLCYDPNFKFDNTQKEKLI